MNTAANNLSSFSEFAKTKFVATTNREDAIIYTRVSSKEQVDGGSLQIQARECRKFAQQRKLTVVKEFGGTYESAQTDERTEFSKMVVFAKRNRVSTIIVYSLDRFSRSGDNAIWLSHQLRNQGISLLSVTQPVEANNPAGAMMQKILLLFAQHDNDQRREKCIAGMQERLRNGYWTGLAPIGYKNVTIGSKKIVTPDEFYSPLIRKAFQMKQKKSFSDVEIAAVMQAAGGKRLTQKMLSVVFKNPFYCGLITHSCLPNEIVEGNHEPLVSREVFLAINHKTVARSGHKWDKERETLPLRAFVRCDVCGTGYAGYLVKSKGLYYYKCNRKGCKCNKSAKVMHERFASILKSFMIQQSEIPLLRDYILNAVHEHTKANRELAINYQSQLVAEKNKLDKLTERFALGEITLDIFEKYAPKYRDEVARITRLLDELEGNLSNPEKCTDLYLEKSQNLLDLWQLGSHSDKVQVQKMMFPEGISYNSKTGQYRTARINGVLALIALHTGGLQNKETGLIIGDNEKSGLVVPTGIEPVSKV